MPTEIIIALLSLAGTLAGSFSGVLVSNSLVKYRLQQLEKKVDKHNSLVERMYRCESRLDAMER